MGSHCTRADSEVADNETYRDGGLFVDYIAKHSRGVQRLLACTRLFQGTLQYEERRKRFCEPLPFLLPNFPEACEAVASYDLHRSRRWHGLASRPLGFFYSSHGGRICTSDWRDEHRVLMESLYESVLEKLNDWEGKPCRFFPIAGDYFARIYALKYDGNSHFGWHYDSVSPTEYRAIFTLKSSERLNLWVMRPEGPQVMMMQSAEGVLMRSGETFHGVFGDSEPATRWVVVFTYTSRELDTRDAVSAADLLSRPR